MHPAILYKYLSPTRVDVLQDLRIRFTQVSALNDPFESFPGAMVGDRAWYLREFLARMGIQSQRKAMRLWHDRKRGFEPFLKHYTDRKQLLDLSQKVQKMSDTVHGCLSLSATETNILMWSHYAGHHKGYVIGFRAEHEFFGNSVVAVNYSLTRPVVNPFEPKHGPELFYTKSTDWAYEHEYRKYQSFVDPIKLPDGGSFLPFTKPGTGKGANNAVVLFPFPRAAIACVILGWKSAPELQDSALRALTMHQLSHVPVYKAQPNLTRYEMELAPLQPSPQQMPQDGPRVSGATADGRRTVRVSHHGQLARIFRCLAPQHLNK